MEINVTDIPAVMIGNSIQPFGVSKVNTAHETSGDGRGAQAEVVALLRDPASYGHDVNTVEVIETHGALIFLAGAEVYKIKKAVRFPYLDFSTLAKRRRACRREIEINRPAAPMIYRGTVAITREDDGHLEIGGEGEPVEWAVHMARFAQDRILKRLAGAGPFSDDLMNRLADVVAAWHRHARPAYTDDGDRRIKAIVDNLKSVFGDAARIIDGGDARTFADASGRQWRRAQTCLAERGRDGYIRRCHGDLHLDNIVLIDNRPVLFDAIEFDETIATVDVLYDLAFLLMDLDQCGQRAAANRILNRYLQLSGEPGDLRGLIALPLFLGCRAGVRAMVALDRANQQPARARGEFHRKARRYFGAACRYLAPPSPVLVAIGGFSGTGKTTLAHALAPWIAGVPGALHLRSDVERKSLAGVDELTRLDPGHYRPETGARVYERLILKAEIALRAGHPVIVDAVFSTVEERTAIAAVAEDAGVAFTGLWLSAEKARLISRVAGRRGDASDATADVVRAQIARGAGPVSWAVIDAGDDAGATLGRAAEMLDLTLPAR